ncbi:PAS/PAC sensor signal transduction histidine kinase [Desulforamulus reducens MI-1]|uniref:histidine kinase n=1 Tax=Desulforamulus reducens (strain ATCC BAA-1160 / DSM 100696 / MI-1) TaxID=349161 RepID=A4J2E4_DESRM|nr:ATP-binding protein [Desulforamulus reducens]ABO49247.1 PAS/PAC sensor signal transduction histidine kinase [Desulforamulus reducens MI-1]
MLKGIRQRTIGSYASLFFIFVCLSVLFYLNIINILTVLLGAFWATVFMAWLTNRRLITPVEQITSVAQEMAGGFLDTEIRVEGEEELDDLAWSINYMARELRKNLIVITEERNRARAILNSMADGVIALDKYGQVILINPVVEEIFKIKETNWLGNKIIKVIRNHELEELFIRALHSMQPVMNSELQVLTPQPRLFNIHVTPLKGNNDEKIGVVGLITDVTERRKLERMRTEFVANVSHELRTPLTSINGFVETLLDGAIEEPIIARNFLEIISAEGKRLANIIDDLLKLSRLEDRRTKLNKQPVDLAEVIGNTITMFEGRALEKNIQITTEISPKLPLVPGDQGFLSQVMINLVDNAIKYTLTGGTVHISVKFNEHEVTVTVSDTGIGIPIESIPRVFERFYRVDKARSREMGGTGLGLSICKHIMEAHGGKIRVESDSSGSQFSFSLPLKE